MSHDFIKQFLSSLPPGLADFKQDIKIHMEANFKQFLNNIDAVTREEFDIQTKVLQKTRSLITQLETRLSDLEKKQPE